MGQITVVLAHGRDAAFDIPATTSQLWADALRDGLDRVGSDYARSVRIEYAYFGGLWRPDAQPPMPVLRGPDGIDYTVQLTPQRRVVPIQAEGLGAAPTGLGTIGRDLSSLVPDWLASPVLQSILPDVFDYLENPILRAAVNEIVASKCTDFAAQILVGFSMGSIVGYDVLRDATSKLPVATFITCGAPLGEKSIHNRLAEDAATTFPPGLKRWINIWNEDDPATSIHGDDLAALYSGGTIDELETQGHKPAFIPVVDFHPFAAHNPYDYLSSLAAGLAVDLAIRAATA